MAEPQQKWLEEGRHQPVPTFSLSELEAGDANNNSEGRVSHVGNKNAPRLMHGNTSRFGMVKGSIAARRANAAAAAAASVRAPTTGSTEHTPTSSSSKTSLVAARAATTATSTGDAPKTQTRPSPQLNGDHEDDDPKGEESYQDHRREEDKEAIRLLGPMGSFYELAKVPSAADLIRTASHDNSSHSVSQARGLRQANVPTAYSAIANTGYYRPSDRIGRLYTSTAAALTSTSAQSVAKAVATLAVAAGAPAGSGSSGGAGSNGGGGGVSKARNNGSLGKMVTAPFAAESREILHTLALQPASSRGALAAALSLGTASSTAVAARPDEGGERGNQSSSPTGAAASSEAFGPRSPGSPGRPKKVVVIDSEQHARTQRREMRSPPRGRRILEVAPSNGGVGPSGRGSGDGAAPSSGEAATDPDGGGGYAVKDFRSWNPAILGGIEGRGGGGGANINQHAVLDGGSSSSAVGGGGGEAATGGGTVVRMSEAERQKESIDRYWNTVEDRMLNGSPNALGAGAKSPLLELPPERVDGITSRLAFELRFIPGIELGAFQAYVEAAVNSMLQDVQVGHCVSVARAVVDYELKDPEGRRALGIERGHLTAGPRWYQCQEYLIPEWRVLRQTGVSRARVRRSALALKRRLCSVETVMVGLEKLWHSGVVPGDWDTVAFGGSGDVVGGNVKPE